MLKRFRTIPAADANPVADSIAALQPADEGNGQESDWQAVAPKTPNGEGWPWDGRPRVARPGLLAGIGKPWLWFESLINRVVGEQTLNPFYHTGTLAVFLLIVVAITGLYLTVFYLAPGVGTDRAYGAVAALDAQPLGIGRIMRGVHRYASGAAVIATLLHALRTLFQDRFRGAHWLAWVTGVVLLAMLWLEGMSGYWLVWDERAQLVLDTVVTALKVFPSIGIPYALNFLTNDATRSIWIFFLILLFAHIALFTLMGLLYWSHVLRLSRARFLPPRHYMIGLGAILIAAALLRPATSAAEANLSRLPGPMTIDPFFLFYLPATLRVTPAFFWGGTLATLALVGFFPWILRGRPPGKVVINKDLCNGCTRCAEDCPFSAIVMQPRTDGTPHKLVAIENPALCVSCGICVGSCDGMAVSLTDLPASAYYSSILARIRAARGAAGESVRVVFTCERHAAHGVSGVERRTVVTGLSAVVGRRSSVEASPMVIAVPCVGALHANVIGQATEAAGAEVLVMGCPPDDCAQREGNLWTAARLDRTRLPRLRREYVGAPLRTAWLPPSESERALRSPVPDRESPNGKPAARPHGAAFDPRRLRPAHLVRGGLLLAAFVAVQVALTDVPYRPFAPDESLLQLGMRNNGQLRQNSRVLTGPELAQLSHEEQVAYLNEQQAEGRFPTRVKLEIDGQVVLDRSYAAQGFHREGSSFALEKFVVTPGEHFVRLSMDDSGGEPAAAFEQALMFAPGQIRSLEFDRLAEAFVLR